MKLLIYIILAQYCYVAYSQESHISWFSNNANEFENFEFLDSSILDKKYVFIGESSHGAKEFFQFRTELAQYLIKNKNFEVVAIESPFMASYFYDHHPNTRIDSLTHMEHVLPYIFCNQTFNNFINSIDSLSVSLVGFDNQLGTDYQAENVTAFVFDKLVKIDSTLAKEYQEISPLFSKNNVVRFSKKEKWFNYPCISIDDSLTCLYWLKKYNKFIDRLTFDYSKLLSICNNDSLMALATLRAVQTVQTDLYTSIYDNQLYIRDSMMAENIKYYIHNRYPNKKIVFLAHNAHISKKYQEVDGNFHGDHRTMMSFLNDSIVNNSLILGLYGIKGESNNNRRQPIEMSCSEQDSTLEYYLKDVVRNRAFVDVRKYPFEAPVNLCHWGKWPELINPKTQYDYLIFIKNLTRSEYFEDQKLSPTKNKRH